MGSRLKVLLIVGGGILAFFGYQEFKVGNDASPTPVPVELAKLEAGEPLPNVHVQVGEHLCLYPSSVYRYKTSQNEEQASASSVLECIYFPIISSEHPWFEEARAAVAKYGSIDAVPDREWPEVKQFTVLVKSTKRFSTVGEIPDDWGEGTEVSGLIVNRISKLSGEERDLVQQAFPRADLDQILILQEGRKPMSKAISLGMIAGGVILALGGVVTLVTGLRN